jgi:hypothetical protein
MEVIGGAVVIARPGRPRAGGRPGRVRNTYSERGPYLHRCGGLPGLIG